MTREELFRAVGQVREEQIQEAAREVPRPRRRIGALAACLAAVLVLGAAAPRIAGQLRHRAPSGSFDPVPGPQTGALDAGGGGSGLDGTDYHGGSDPDRPARPSYSEGVSIGQLSGPGDGAESVSSASCTAWLTPEEILAQDTVIFRGTVRELQYFRIDPEAPGMGVYYTRALVEVTDSIRGGLTEGETCALLYMGAKGRMSTSLSGPLEDLEEGGDAIFMPARTGPDTGWRWTEDSCFCYADLAELYLSEGLRFVFADTAEGLSFARDVYADLAEAETLDQVADYLREAVGPVETARPAGDPSEFPIEPQAGPSETVQAGEPSGGPGGARALPGGATVPESVK